MQLMFEPRIASNLRLIVPPISSMPGIPVSLGMEREYRRIMLDHCGIWHQSFDVMGGTLRYGLGPWVRGPYFRLGLQLELPAKARRACPGPAVRRLSMLAVIAIDPQFGENFHVLWVEHDCVPIKAFRWGNLNVLTSLPHCCPQILQRFEAQVDTEAGKWDWLM